MWARELSLPNLPISFFSIKRGKNTFLFDMGKIKIKGTLSSLQLMWLTFGIVSMVLLSGILYVIATGNGTSIGSFATNGYDTLSPGKYSMIAALVTEVVLTFIFLLVILGSTDERAPKGFAGLAIGLCLTLIHLISIPITNTSVNPARSTSQAIFVGGEPLSQLWLFWLAPILGAIVAGFIYKNVLQKNEE